MQHARERRTDAAVDSFVTERKRMRKLFETSERRERRQSFRSRRANKERTSGSRPDETSGKKIR